MKYCYIKNADGKWDVVIAVHPESDCLMEGELTESDFQNCVEITDILITFKTKEEAISWIKARNAQ